MKAVPYVLFFLCYSWNIHFLPIEHLTIESISRGIKQCTIEQRLDEHERVSVFIEEVTTHPMTLHIIEPIRVSVEASLSNDKKEFLQESWITLFVYKDSSSCFLRDDVKTETMEKKSKRIQDQLRDKMFEKNEERMHENNFFEKIQG